MRNLFHDLFSQADTMPFSITYTDGPRRNRGDAGESKFDLIFRTDESRWSVAFEAHVDEIGADVR